MNTFRLILATVSILATLSGWPGTALAQESATATNTPQPVPPKPKPPLVAVFLGDSYTKYWGKSGAFRGRPYVIEGRSGATSEAMLVSKDGKPSLFEAQLALKPQVLVIMAGINDFGQGRPPEAVMPNLATMVTQARAAGIRVVLCTQPPVGPKGDNYAKSRNTKDNLVKLNELIRAYCAANQVVLCDFHPALVGEDGFRKPEYHAVDPNDDVHPGPKAFEVMTPLAEVAIKTALAQDAPPAPAGK